MQVLDVVAQAELAIAAQTQSGSLNKEYLGVEGNPEFCALSREFVLGSQSAAIKANRVTTVQTLSGTGLSAGPITFPSQIAISSDGTSCLG